MMIKYLILARKIHRIFVLISVALVMVMAGTGLMMKYGSIASLDPGMVRYIHNQMSIFLTIVLVIMMITGLTMYFGPILMRIRRKP